MRNLKDELLAALAFVAVMVCAVWIIRGVA